MIRRFVSICFSILAFSAAVPRPSAAQPAQPSAAEPLRHVPDLHTVLNLAQSHARAVIDETGSVNSARAGYVGARLSSWGNPAFELTADRGDRNVTKDVTLRGLLAWPIEIAGQRGKRVAEVDAQLKWRELVRSAAQREALGQALARFGAFQVSMARVHLLEQMLENSRSEVNLFRERKAAGDTTEEDSKLAEIEQSRIDTLLFEAKARRTGALFDLSNLTGETYHLGHEVPGPVIQPPATVLNQRDIEQKVVNSNYLQALGAQRNYFLSVKERSRADAYAPLQALLIVGRGDYGETRVGAGLALSLPFLRSNQGEQARALAEADRAGKLLQVTREILTRTLLSLSQQLVLLREAVQKLSEAGEPAAAAALAAALELHYAGKADFLHVLTVRRELWLVKTRRLELIEREWALVGEIAGLTGEVP